MVLTLARPETEVFKRAKKPRRQTENFKVIGRFWTQATTTWEPIRSKTRKTVGWRSVGEKQRSYLQIQGGGHKGLMWERLQELVADGTATIHQNHKETGYTAKIYTDRPHIMAGQLKELARVQSLLIQW